MEWRRQGIHIAAGVLVLTLRFLPFWAVLCLSLFGILFNLFFLPLLFPSIMRGVSGDRRGVVFYPVAIAALVLVFPTQLEIVAGAWAVLSVGDGFATLVGKLGKPIPLRWNPHKTSQGTVACFFFGALACMGAIFFVNPELSQDWERWAIAAVVAAGVAAWVESLPLPVNDNLTVPFSAAAILWIAGYIDVDKLDQLSGGFVLMAIVGNGVLAIILTSFRIIHGSATWAGLVVGSIVWICGGWQCYLALMLFFVIATLATKHGYERKAWRGIAQEDEGRRGARHVVANCGIPALLSFFAGSLPDPYSDWMRVAVIASLATAMFDTVSSEIGQVYGRHPVLPTTGEQVPIGTEGAISMEGTLAGLMAAVFLAFAAWILGAIPATLMPVVVVAAFIGACAESVIAAMVQVEFTWKNEILNFINTALGAAVALLVCWRIHFAG